MPKNLRAESVRPTKQINFLPGPVHINDSVAEVFGRAPISHRDETYSQDLQAAKRRLLALTHARQVEFCLGSGTLANDLTAAQLSAVGGKGFILSNGEFGERLINHAQRFCLDFHTDQIAWGDTFDVSKIATRLQQEQYSWLWFVHHETSTGVLNDLNRLSALGRQNDMLICADCISSVGAVALDLQGIDFASGTSGKALGGFPGLSFIFFRKCYPSAKLPRYLDLSLYIQNNGIPFTGSSNLMSSLRQALSCRAVDKTRYSSMKAQTIYLRALLKRFGIPVLVEDPDIAPVVTTIQIPRAMSSITVGDSLKAKHFQIHYQSSYLRERNWIQVASMSVYPQELIGLFVEEFAALL